MDPLKAAYPELTPYNFASNTPIQSIDLEGLQSYRVTDEKGEIRSQGTYDNGASESTRSTIDAIAQADEVTTTNIDFEDAGSVVIDASTWQRPSDSYYHVSNYTYCGTDACGNEVQGSGTMYTYVANIKTGASLLDVITGGIMSYFAGQVSHVLVNRASNQGAQTLLRSSDELFTVSDDLVRGIKPKVSMM